MTDQACFSELIVTEGDRNLAAKELGRVTLDKKKTIQHSHAPCLTQNWLIAHIDHFHARNPFGNNNTGMLKELHQLEDNEWMVMNRQDRTTRVLTSDFGFVNNHFWNCVEREDGIVVETVAVTRDYLDFYFRDTLAQPTTPWSKLFLPAQRCVVPFSGDKITCKPLLDETWYFDYPTYNPLYKTSREYTYFYAIAARESSRWLDTLIKVDSNQGKVVAQWHQDNIFFTEADFIPSQQASQAIPVAATEDDGLLLTILYNQTSDSSSVAFFDARQLTLVDSYPLNTAVPFHAHGVICLQGRCFPNP